MRTQILSLLFLFLFNYSNAQEANFIKDWASYVINNGHTPGEFITGIEIDHKNNAVYIIKTDRHTPGSEPRIIGSLTKFSLEGEFLWTTEAYGNTLGLSIDSRGDIIIAGHTAAEEGIASSGAFQERYGGGTSDAYLMKFDKEGNKLWGTYYGGTDSERPVLTTAQYYISLEVDVDDNIIWAFGTKSEGLGTPNTFQENLETDYSYLISSFSPEGSRNWATYYGTSNDMQNRLTDMQVDETGIYISGWVWTDDFENSYFDTSGDYVFTANSRVVFISKFDFTGNRLWSYYLPKGNGLNYSMQKGLHLNNNHLYFTYATSSKDLGTENTSFPTKDEEGAEDIYYNTGALTKLDLDGNIIWTTYLPGRHYISNNYCNIISSNENGDLYILAESGAIENDILDAYHPEMESKYKINLMKFDEDGQYIYGNYLFQNSNDELSSFMGMSSYEDEIYIHAWHSDYENIASEGAFQDTPRVEYARNTFIAKFIDTRLNVDKFEQLDLSVFPNPTSSVLYYSINDSEVSSLVIEVYDIQARIIKTKNTLDTSGFLNLGHLSSGTYLVKFNSENGLKSNTKKIIIK